MAVSLQMRYRALLLNYLAFLNEEDHVWPEGYEEWMKRIADEAGYPLRPAAPKKRPQPKKQNVPSKD